MSRAVRVAATAVLFVAVGGTSAHAGSPTYRSVVLRVHDVSLAEMLQVPGVTALATRGGAALLAHAARLDQELDAARTLPEIAVEDLGSGSEAMTALRARVAELGADASTAVWIVSDGSGLQGDELGALVVSVPTPWLSGASTRSLTSDSTHRDGVVVSEDIGPTLCAIAFAESSHGCADLSGSSIRPIEAPPPIGLHERYLENRRISVPIQTAAGLFVALAGILGVHLLRIRGRAPRSLVAAAPWLATAVIPLAIALLFAGHLWSLTYPVVLPFLVAVPLAWCLGFAALARVRGTMAALVGMGALTLGCLALEAALGWTAALTTLLGGTQLDGGRFYGLPNVDIGLLLGAAVLVAVGMRSVAAGTVLIAAVALFAGLPFAGANLGGAVTLSAAVGLWWALRSGRRVPVVALAGLAAAAAGLVVTLAANRFLPGPATHITGFVEGAGGGVIETVLNRLRVGIDLLATNPFALIPVIGVPLVLAAVLRPVDAVASSFARHPGWREALLTILLGSVVAYVANDTGPAALGLGFGIALAGVLFVSLRDRAAMMEGS